MNKNSKLNDVAEELLKKVPEKQREKVMNILKDLQDLREKQADEVAQHFINHKVYEAGEIILGLFIQDYCTLVLHDALKKVMDYSNMQFHLENKPELKGN